ncbi:MAG: hypothetical protein MK081_06205 [Flavobacteriales bacterium]|nr:hypothetical protein [Flavobacteriales bacterium]
MLKRLSVLFLIVLALSGSRCNEETQIPFVQVNFQIDTNLPAYIDITAPAGWVYTSGGSRGLIIYRKNQDEFLVFDRHSTYNIDDGCQVTVDDDNILISDPCSESQWVIVDGSVANGPAGRGLHQYNTIWSPPVLTVTN